MGIVVTQNTGSGNYTEGWHDVEISKTKKGDYNGSGYVDLWFKDYPESLKCRVWEARNQEGEEFSVTNMVRYSNPEILEELPDKDGAAVAKLDDSNEAMIGKKLQVMFYKNAKGYTEVSQKVAPIEEFENIIDNMTLQRIEGIKASAEKYQAKRNEAKKSVDTADNVDSDVPF